ncbi:MAG: hypothetical protein KAJ22_00365 [Candidatus Izimaplasma sp.]|nr:hypothetical protein [Candidatus Izimaplasma bacterium]
MIEKLKMYMKKKYNYDLSEYKIYESEKKKNKFLLLPTLLFFVVLIGYALQAAFFIPNIYGFAVVGVVGLILAIYQVVLINKNKPKVFIVTPEYIIKCFSANTFVVLKFDKIS